MKMVEFVEIIDPSGPGVESRRALIKPTAVAALREVPWNHTWILTHSGEAFTVTADLETVIGLFGVTTEQLENEDTEA